VLSAEDTGSGEKFRRHHTATEWWVAFYRAGRVAPAPDVPSGFLAADRSDHADRSPILDSSAIARTIYCIAAGLAMTVSPRSSATAITCISLPKTG
tara:strand:- start:944 stop:1231 length:288 start_codon:yes stop_codon:yes gene_type:complete